MKKLLTFALYTMLLLAMGIYGSKVMFDSMAATEQARLDKVRAGESARIGGYQFLKVSEVKR